RGVNWPAMKRKYEPLLQRIGSRDELNDIFKQMMGELNALHSQVRGGDMPRDDNATRPGMLGAVLTDRKNGVEITRIYAYDTELPGTAPALARAQVDARDGDLIIAVNGAEVKNRAELYGALQNQAGKQVLLTLRRASNTHQTVVVPGTTRSDAQHRYQDWVANNRASVSAADPQIGYVHLQSMVGRDVGSFASQFHADGDKQGMIIDVRRNNGGNVDSWLIMHLLREAWVFWDPRRVSPYPNMQRAFRGHLVVIADERTYSDGETFTAAIKSFGIADVIGRRTAGAGVWLNNRNRQADGGLARVAQSPVFDMEGNWVVEGYGVSPTIEVVNYPHATFNGEDAQLSAAIEHLQRKIEAAPVPPLTPRPFPQDLGPGKDVPARD
ncbi:MAG: S41 family peptidase, partial [Pseudomonadota bacterium]